MSTIPSPILIFGDKYLSKNNIISTKKRHSHLNWREMSASSNTMDEIRAEIGTESFINEEKVVVIQDIPNKKDYRDFLLSVSKEKVQDVSIIIVDTKNVIKVSSSTGTFDKSWGDFIKSFKKINGSKVVNNGESYNEKTKDSCFDFVEKTFMSNGVQIKKSEIDLLISIVGYNKGMLVSDIKKLCINCPSPITSDYIVKNAFTGSQEAVIYKLSNALDNSSYTSAINCVDEFVKINGINENVIADIIFKKARWQLAASYYYYKGFSWNEITSKIMSMGKMPSFIWHHPDIEIKNKTELSDKFKDDLRGFLVKKQGIPYNCFKNFDETSLFDSKNKQEVLSEDNKKKKKRKKTEKKELKTVRPEIIPMRFMAESITGFIRDKLVSSNSNHENIKELVYKRSMAVYLFSFEKLVEVRKGNEPLRQINDAIRMFVNLNLSVFS